MNGQLPTNWFGLIGVAIIVGFPALLAAWQSRRNRVKLGTVQDTVDTVNAQVTNGHHTNLRDDVTEALRLMGIVKTAVESLQDNDIKLIRGDISRISGDISVLRGELTDERDARTDLENRFDDRERGNP